MLNHWYEIPDGYQIIVQHKTIDISCAEEMLKTKMQNKYTSANRTGDLATLAKHIICCPHCRKSYPAYSRYLDMWFGTFSPTHKRVSKETIAAWGTPQYSFFPQEDASLIFNQVFEPNGGIYQCPHCKNESREARAVNNVMVKYQRKKVSVICQTKDIGDLFRIPWAYRTTSPISFPLTEEVTFNFKTGKTYIQLCSKAGDLIAVRNVTQPGDWNTSKVYSLLRDNTLIRRSTVHAFRQVWRADLPFTMAELTPDQLIPLCAYIGYPQSFYLKIPYADREYRADKSFSAITKQIHTVQNLHKALRNAYIPQCKSARKIFFQNPDYAFYIREFEILYDCLQNVDLFLMLFNKVFTYNLLTFLHQYHGNTAGSIGPAVFFKDYARIRSPHILLQKMENSITELQVYAVHYACMDPASRKREQKKWKCESVPCHPAIPYSVPMPSSSIPDSKIDGFRFTLLKTKKQYQEAGRELHNCLGDWQYSNNPVFVIKDDHKHMAAIEIKNDTTITQAYGPHNQPIPYSASFYKAFEQWKDINHLSEPYDTAYEDQPEEPHLLQYLDYASF